MAINADTADHSLTDFADNDSSAVDCVDCTVEHEQPEADVEHDTHEKPAAVSAKAADTDSNGHPHQRMRPLRAALVAGLITLVAAGALAGWFCYQLRQQNNLQRTDAMYLTAARQAAINLTTIDFAEADRDVKRVLDSSTGTFHDEFQKNSTGFADAVRRAQAQTVGTVTEAAIESVSGQTAQVLVAISVKSTIAGKPEQQPRLWRMRITTVEQGNGVKVSNVGFVP